MEIWLSFAFPRVADIYHRFFKVGRGERRGGYTHVYKGCTIYVISFQIQFDTLSYHAIWTTLTPSTRGYGYLVFGTERFEEAMAYTVADPENGRFYMSSLFDICTFIQ